MEPSVVNDNGRILSTDPDDNALVIRVAQGDVIAFGLLYDRYVRAVYALAVHLLGTSDAEEAVQDIFLRLWNKADQFDAARGSFAAWFMTIARNHAFRELDMRSRRQRIESAEDIDRLLSQRADTTTDVEEQAWLHEQGRAALLALNALPVEQRRVLVLAYFGGLSQSAIAQHLDQPLGTVKKRTQLGLQKLRRALDREHGTNAPAVTADDSISSSTRARIHDGL
jgi:RNA polymerase sigma-70 factor (ECF subfamily)